MKSRPQLWLLAGGNGAGKTTFYERFLAARGIAFVNADRIARDLAPTAPEASSYEAARIAGRVREELLRERVSFCFETVFSHPSKLDFLAKAKAHGYDTVLVFVHVENSELNLARVAQRVAMGGHDVPEEKLVARIERSFGYVQRALSVADRVLFFDNSSFDDPFRHVASCVAGVGQLHADPGPAWVREMLRDRLGC